MIMIDLPIRSIYFLLSEQPNSWNVEGVRNCDLCRCPDEYSRYRRRASSSGSILPVANGEQNHLTLESTRRSQTSLHRRLGIVRKASHKACLSGFRTN